MKLRFSYSALLWLPLAVVLYSGINLLIKPYGLDGIHTLSHKFLRIDKYGNAAISIKSLHWNLDAITSVINDFGKDSDMGILSADWTSISISHLTDALDSVPSNAPFISYIDSLKANDHLHPEHVLSAECRIISYNGIDWKDKLYPPGFDYSYYSKPLDKREGNELVISCAGKPFVVHVNGWRVPPLALVYNVFPTIAAMLLALSLSLVAFLCDKTRFRYIYLGSYVLTTGIVFSKLSLISGATSYSSFNTSHLFNWQLIAFYIPLLRFFTGYWKWLWRALIAFNIYAAIYFEGLPRIILLATVIFLVMKEKGVNKRYYRYSLYLFIYLITSFVLVLLSPFSLRSFPVVDVYSTVVDALLDSLFLSLFYIVFMDVYFRLIRAKLIYIEMASIVFIFGMTSLLVAKYLITVFLLNSAPAFLAHINPLLCLAAAAVVSLLILRLFPIAHPVTLKLQKVKEKFLAESYTYIDAQQYVDFMLNYIKLLIYQNSLGIVATQVKTGIARVKHIESRSHNLAFITDPATQEIVGFPMFDREEVDSIWRHLQETGKRLNIDIEILNGTVTGKRYSYYDSPDYPHLFFPVFDHQNQLIGVLALGKSRGVYWHDKLASALEEVFVIFKNLYLNLRTQEELRRQSVSLAHEQEARAYVEQLEQVTREKNTILVEERLRVIQSIEYASLIQKSMLPQPEDLKQCLQDHFVIWKPRDIVGGDLYWHYTSVYPAYTYLAAIDCTGHGVPGALLTMTVNSLLYSIIKDKKILNPGEILTQLHREISAALHQNLDTTRQDGLEISLIRFDPLHHTFLFSGAGLHIVLFDGKTTEFIRGDRFGIGGGRWHDELLFNEQMGNYNESSVFYMFTDGIVDQPNPQLTRRRRLGQAAWRDWIDSVTGMELAAQRVALEQYLAEMLHYHEQRDDITVMGFIPGGGGA